MGSSSWSPERRQSVSAPFIASKMASLIHRAMRQRSALARVRTEPMLGATQSIA